MTVYGLDIQDRVVAVSNPEQLTVRANYPTSPIQVAFPIDSGLVVFKWRVNHYEHDSDSPHLVQSSCEAIGADRLLVYMLKWPEGDPSRCNVSTPRMSEPEYVVPCEWYETPAKKMETGRYNICLYACDSKIDCPAFLHPIETFVEWGNQTVDLGELNLADHPYNH